MSLITRQAYYVETVQASTTQTATGTGNGVRLPDAPTAIAWTLDVTAASGTTPTLDVGIDTRLDGTNWTRVVQFIQLTAVARRVSKQNNASTTAEFDATSAPSAGQVRNIIGDEWRAVWTIGGTTPSFTFSVTALVM